MKHVKISYIGFIALFSLAFHLLLFTSSNEFYLPSTMALDEEIYNKKSQNTPGNINSVIKTTQNNDLNNLAFSDPFYLSNDTLILDKILFENSSATNREAQFFVERGFINGSLVTYNLGYYVEDLNFSGPGPEPNSLRNNHETGSAENYAKGSGIFLTENGEIIKWDAFDQIINKSKDTLKYAGIIFFSSSNVAADNSKNSELSFLINKVGLYEFSVYSKSTTTASASIDITTSNTTASTPNPTHRTIWLWPNTTQ